MSGVCLCSSYVKLTAEAELRAAHAHAQSLFSFFFTVGTVIAANCPRNVHYFVSVSLPEVIRIFFYVVKFSAAHNLCMRNPLPYIAWCSQGTLFKLCSKCGDDELYKKKDLATTMILL